MSLDSRLFPKVVRGRKGEYVIYMHNLPQGESPGEARMGQFSIAYRDEKLKKSSDGEKGEIALTSRRSPEREARRLLGGFELKEGLVAIVLGGAGSALIEVLLEAKRKRGGRIVVVEADDLFLAALRKLFPSIYDSGELVFLSGSLEEVVEQGEAFFNENGVEGVIGFRSLAVGAAVSLDPPFYAQAEGAFKSEFSSRISDLFTRLQFEARWILNSMVNSWALPRGVAARSLFGAARGGEALLVSTGPSLRERLPWIAANRDRYFIACVDSAYRVLLRAGITPHLIFSLDSQAHTYKHFYGLPKGGDVEFPILYADLVANPVVVAHWEGPLAMGVTAAYKEDVREVTTGCDFIEENILGGSLGDIQSGGSVATSLFDLLRLMGFDAITLVGQDLAYTYKEIHCMGTHHYDEWLSNHVNRLNGLENINYSIIRRRQTRVESSIRGVDIDGDYVLGLYRRWFEGALNEIGEVGRSKSGQPRVYNHTAEGVPIRGAEKWEEGSVPREGVGAVEKRIKGIIDSGAGGAAMGEGLRGVAAKMVDVSAGEAVGAGFTFMAKIGRRFLLRALRRPDSVSAEELDGAKRRQRLEQNLFWSILRRRFLAAASRR